MYKSQMGTEMPQQPGGGGYSQPRTRARARTHTHTHTHTHTEAHMLLCLTGPSTAALGLPKLPAELGKGKAFIPLFLLFPWWLR